MLEVITQWKAPVYCLVRTVYYSLHIYIGTVHKIFKIIKNWSMGCITAKFRARRVQCMRCSPWSPWHRKRYQVAKAILYNQMLYAKHSRFYNSWNLDIQSDGHWWIDRYSCWIRKYVRCLWGLPHPTMPVITFSLRKLSYPFYPIDNLYNVNNYQAQWA